MLACGNSLADRIAACMGACMCVCVCVFPAFSIRKPPLPLYHVSKWNTLVRHLLDYFSGVVLYRIHDFFSRRALPLSLSSDSLLHTSEVPRELCKERVILHVLHWFSKTKEAREDDHAGLPPCGVDRFVLVCRCPVAGRVQRCATR